MQPHIGHLPCALTTLHTTTPEHTPPPIPMHLGTIVAMQTQAMQCSPPCYTQVQHSSTPSHQVILPFRAWVRFPLHKTDGSLLLHLRTPSEGAQHTDITRIDQTRQSCTVTHRGQQWNLTHGSRISVTISWATPYLPNNPPYLPPFLTHSFLGTGRHPHKNYININLARLWTNPLAPNIPCKPMQ